MSISDAKSSSSIKMPTRVLKDYLSSSEPWLPFLGQGGFVESDIIVADPFKAGTTWTQRILQQILHNGEEPEGGLSDTSPWLDSSWGDHKKMLVTLADQAKRGQRRVIKSHLPADALPIDPKARYVFIARNGKDLGISLHNYLYHFTPETIAQINKLHKAWCKDHTDLAIPADLHTFFNWWLDTQGGGCCDLLDIMRSWWELRKLPNVILVNYRRLKEDLRGEVLRLAAFVGVDTKSLKLDTIVEHCQFGYMKQRAEKMVPFGGAHMPSAEAFFHKGPERDYTSELTREQIERWDKMALQQLGPECAHWLETGLFTATDSADRKTSAAGGKTA